MAKEGRADLPHHLWALHASLWLIARLVAPVLPTFSREVLAQLGDPSEPTWPVPDGEGRVLTRAPALTFPAVATPLFPRLDDAAQGKIFAQIVGEHAAPAAPAAAAAAAAPAQAKAKAPAAAAPATPAAASAPAAAAAPGPAEASAASGASIKIADFAKIELRTGRVLSAAPVPKAKKLLHLSVDLGEPQPRSIVAGIAEAYAPDQLVGKQVIVVANLEPATIRGIRSEGMILAAGDEAIAGLSAVDRDVPPGTRVR